mgnify:CR=1 FL=1
MIDRERVADFIELHRFQLVIALSAILLVLILVVAISLISASGKPHRARTLTAASSAGALKPAEVWIPSEPLPVPGVQLFRETGAQWSPAEVEKWYTVPDEKSLEELRAAGRKPIDEILESVP